MDSSMDTDSETMMVINKSTEAVDFDKPKRDRHMKTPSQLDALEAAFTGMCMLYCIFLFYLFSQFNVI